MSQEYQYWLRYLRRRSVNFTIKKYKFHFGTLVRGRNCRTRNLEEAFLKFSSISDIKTPKKQFVKNMGRCNLKKQPKLYLSSSTISIPKEIGLKAGDFFCVGHFIAKSKSEYGPYSILGHRFLTFSSILKTIVTNYTSNFTDEQIKFDSTLGRIMTTKKTDNGFDIYAVTNAITSMIFQKNKLTHEFGWNSNERIMALIYPCVHFAFNAFNIVMNQKEADKIFDVKKLYILEFEGYTINGDLKITEKAKGSVNQSTGNINWHKTPDVQKALIVF